MSSPVQRSDATRIVVAVFALQLTVVGAVFDSFALVIGSVVVGFLAVIYPPVRPGHRTPLEQTR